MANKGKKYQDSTKLVEKTKLYDANEAIALAVCSPSPKMVISSFLSAFVMKMGTAAA